MTSATLPLRLPASAPDRNAAGAAPTRSYAPLPGSATDNAASRASSCRSCGCIIEELVAEHIKMRAGLVEVEEEDHGTGDVETVVPEVLPAGTRAAEGGAS